MNFHGDETSIDPEKFLSYIRWQFKRDLKTMIAARKEMAERREGERLCRWCPKRLFSKCKD